MSRRRRDIRQCARLLLESRVQYRPVEQEHQRNVHRIAFAGYHRGRAQGGESLVFHSIRNDCPALIVFSRLVQFLERYKDHVLPVKSARDVYLAVRRKKPSAKAEPEADVAQVEDVAEDAEGQEASVAKRSTRGTAFVNFEGESKEKIEIGTRQFVRFTDSLPLTPTKGTFDVNNIRESPYFFS